MIRNSIYSSLMLVCISVFGMANSAHATETTLLRSTTNFSQTDAIMTALRDAGLREGTGKEPIPYGSYVQHFTFQMADNVRCTPSECTIKAAARQFATPQHSAALLYKTLHEARGLISQDSTIEVNNLFCRKNSMAAYSDPLWICTFDTKLARDEIKQFPLTAEESQFMQEFFHRNSQTMQTGAVLGHNLRSATISFTYTQAPSYFRTDSSIILPGEERYLMIAGRISFDVIEYSEFRALQELFIRVGVTKSTITSSVVKTTQQAVISLPDSEHTTGLISFK